MLVVLRQGGIVATGDHQLEATIRVSGAKQSCAGESERDIGIT